MNDPKEDYSSQIVTIEHGVGVPKLKENGTWATYSKLLVPKKYHQNISPTHNIHLYNHKLAPKQRLQRPKSGHNTIHKSHGISHHDLLNGIGKTVASETPCKKQPKSHASKASKSVVHHSIRDNPIINNTSRLNASTTNTSTNTTSILPLVPYPSPRTKWTRTLGGALKGGGPLTNIKITLLGSQPYDLEDDSRMITITCIDSNIECSLSLIQYHSTMVKNLLQECDSCKSEVPCLLKPAIILPDYSTQTVSSLLILLKTGTTTVINQEERINIQELQRFGFPRANPFSNLPFTPRKKEKWQTRCQVKDDTVLQSVNSLTETIMETATQVSTTLSPGDKIIAKG